MKLIRYLKPYWYLAMLSPLFMVCEVMMDLSLPKLMSTIVDDGVLGGDLGLIIRTGGLMLLLAAIGGATGIGAAGFGSAASQNFGNDLRKDVFKKVMGLSLQQTDMFTTGSLVTRLTNDVTMVQELVNMSLRMFVRTILLFGGGLAMALSLNVNFALILFCVMPIQIVIVAFFLRKASPLFSVVQKKLDKVNAVVQENVSGARVIKAYVREDYEIGRFNQANNDLKDANMRVQKVMAAAMPIMMLVMNLSVVAIIYAGGLQVKAQAMQVGQVMAAITYVTQILMSLIMVSMLFQMVSRAQASAARIREVLNTEPVILDGDGKGVTSQASGGAVILKNVSFHYPNYSNRPVLHDVNLEVEPGQMVAILGATGSGKSTLVNLIPRFYDPNQGEVYIDGIDARDYPLDALRSKIGFVLQKSEIFSGTLAENIRWGDENATDEEVRQAARIAQADEYIQTFNEKYDTIVGESGASLSGGQKQRLAIARAILRKPEILIFDDSTSALDLTTEARLQKALRENLKGTTIIMIAQRVASVMGADKIAVLDNGAIAACGTHQELLETSPLYRDIYDSQMRNGVAAHE